jgi:probable phosphoglycerate mutase
LQCLTGGGQVTARGGSAQPGVSFPDISGRYDAELVTAAQESGPSVSFAQHRFAPPPGATELVLVRHGQSEAYVPGRLFPLVDGHGDPPLSAEGAQQGIKVADRLGKEPISAIYATTLQRTVQTAAPLAERLGLDLEIEADLREVHLGDWEGGIYRQMVAEGHPLILQAAAEERWDVIPGAEPSAALAGRVRAAIERIAARHPGERVAAFTHGGVIGQALSLASGSRPFAFVGAANASISRLVITSERWIVRSFNGTEHLDGLA